MTAYLTRNGVARDLKYSPYTFQTIVDGQKVQYNFSSRLHLDNFIKKRSENNIMIYNEIYRRFKVKISTRLIADLNLYNKIESRGFYIKCNNEEFVCLDNILLSGVSEMKKSLGVLLETSTINSGD